MEGRTKRSKKKANRDADGDKRDYLTGLPEPLLHHIFSYLTMDDVVRTSVLAKNWRYIWSSVPCLNFLHKTSRPNYREIAFINGALLLHKGTKVQKLNITFRYKSTDICHVDLWIHFAFARNVTELYLQFLDRQSLYGGYELPDLIFSCSSLTILALKFCSIKFPINYKLSSLKILSLVQVNFSGGDINRLISSSPVLEHLSLENSQSNSNFNLDLSIMNVAVKTLKIKDTFYYCSNTNLKVYAPFIVSFELVSTMPRKNCVIKRMHLLESAIFYCNYGPIERFCEEDKRRKVVKILNDVRHVKSLRLCSCFIQALSCREEERQDFLTFEVACLGIKTGFAKWELPGISYLLRHSPNIVTLIINIDYFEAIKPKDESSCKFNSVEGEYWKLQDTIFIDLLQNLRTVQINDFMKNVNMRPITKTAEFLEQLQNDMNFLRFLLKNSKVLERMIIRPYKSVNYSDMKTEKLKLQLQITQELLAFPRASQDAEISFIWM